MSLGTEKVGVLVVGAGLAGLAAACRAAELGSDAMLLDKGGFLGEGNTLTTSGVFYTAGISPSSDPDELYSRTTSSGSAYPETARAWADNCRRTLAWLETIGIHVDRTGDGPPRLESNSPVSMGPVYKVDVGASIVKKMRAFFQSHGGRSTSNAKVVKLVSKKGRVVGVEFISGGKKAAMRSTATVLATGGFQANGELLRKYVGRRADQCKLMGSAGAMGEGLKMSLEVGAKAVNLQYFYGRMVSMAALKDDRFWPYPTMGTLVEDGLVVDKRGRRFRDEAWGDIPLANTVARWDDITGASLVFGEVAWERSKGDPDSLVPPNPWLFEKGGSIYRADSIAELAPKLGVVAKNLEATVEEFNRAAARRKLGELAVPRINNPGALAPPFYGVKLTPGIMSTMGGPLINGRMSVMNRKGKSIPGLYAAGDVVGGLMGGPNGGYIGGVAQAAVTGMLAGESAHKLVSKIGFN